MCRESEVGLPSENDLYPDLDGFDQQFGDDHGQMQVADSAGYHNLMGEGPQPGAALHENNSLISELFPDLGTQSAAQHLQGQDNS